VAVVGLGAVGSVVAAALDGLVDLRVTVRHGGHRLPRVIGGPTGDHRVAAVTMADPATATVADWVIIAVKAQDTRTTWPWLRRLVGPVTRVAVLQNGLDIGERMPEWIPGEHVLPVSVYLSAVRDEAGDVRVQRLGPLVVPQGALGSEFADLLGCRLDVHETDRFEVESWRKFMLNLVSNSLGAPTDRTTGAVLCTPLRATAAQMLDEAVTVARAVGVPLSDTDVAATIGSIAALPAHTVTSMQSDRRRGRPLERRFLSGTLVAMADRVGVPVPVTRAVDSLLVAIDRPE
jgi:2-dehydropantoate 2-reductase